MEAANDSSKEKVVNIEDAKKELKAAAPAPEENVLKLSKVYKFEDREISEIDFSGMEDIKAADMVKAEKVLANSGTVAAVPQLNLQYTLIMAASATGIPVEFFMTLKPADAMAVKNMVSGFFFAEE